MMCSVTGFSAAPVFGMATGAVSGPMTFPRQRREYITFIRNEGRDNEEIVYNFEVVAVRADAVELKDVATGKIHTLPVDRLDQPTEAFIHLTHFSDQQTELRFIGQGNQGDGAALFRLTNLPKDIGLANRPPEP